MKVKLYSLQNKVILTLKMLKRAYLMPKMMGDLTLIRLSGLFDEAWYLAHNPVIAVTRVDPALHFLLYGGFHGRDPSPNFPSAWYLATHNDAVKARINPLVYYLKYGQNEGWLDDKKQLEAVYKKEFNRPINFDTPQTFTEKLQIYKLYYRKPLLTQLADKYRVRDYIAEKVGKEYLVPLLGIYDRADEIPIETLPEQFVIKVNHGSGWNIFCKDKYSFDWMGAKTKINYYLGCNYYWDLREWPYKNIEPKIIIEKFIKDNVGGRPFEFKVYCYNGIPKIINLQAKSFPISNGLREQYYDENWDLLPFRTQYPVLPEPIERPNQLDEMLEVARKLSAECPFVRIDYYLLPDKIYCGEMTFYPGSGLDHYDPPQWDEIQGSWFDISGFYDPSVK